MSVYRWRNWGGNGNACFYLLVKLCFVLVFWMTAGAWAETKNSSAPGASGSSTHASTPSALIAAAEAGNTAAMMQLARMSQQNMGVSKNARIRNAAMWMEKAARAGDGFAMCELAEMYLGGMKHIPRKERIPQAIRWLQKAADAGSSHAMARLCRLCVDGDFVPRDPVKADKWFCSAAEAGCKHLEDLGFACRNVGNHYKHGYDYSKGKRRKMPKDPEKAALWYSMAATWYGKAVERGESNAMLELGSMYQSGEGVPQDFAAAEKWFRKAADAGVGRGLDRLGSMYYSIGFGHDLEKDYVEAAKWYQKGLKVGNGDAAYHLGCLYREGKGVPKDEVRAQRLFALAGKSPESVKNALYPGSSATVSDNARHEQNMKNLRRAWEQERVKKMEQYFWEKKREQIILNNHRP